MSEKLLRSKEEFDTVKSLGSGNTQYKNTYSPEVLETFINKHQENDYVVTFDAYELTTNCPRYHQ